MRPKNKKANFIIIWSIILLLILVIIIQILIISLKNKEQPQNNISIGNGTTKDAEVKTVKEIIENAGSKYINMNEGISIKIYVDFKYNLYDENGKSKKGYFYDIIEQIVELKKETFYLIDEEKNIEIFVNYNKENDKYKVKINKMENFYDETDGDSYVDLAKTEIVHQNAFGINNDLYNTIQLNGMCFANTILVPGKREKSPNGYYIYSDEHIKAKLAGGRVLNIIFDKDYSERIATNVYVTTKLKDVESQYPQPGFGSSKEGFLGYRSSNDYVFLYEDEVSIYPYQYKENEYFDKYLSDYCSTGDLDKLVSDFTTEWSSYFEFDYDAENQNLKLVFPTRGIAMDIKNNDSKGITIYNNYYLTDTVKELIKNNKISINPDEDLLFITEQNRRESMK